ncbi:hypothetical protein [Nocardiopsis sp. CC223A]|uniref:hypothetical protein n=1 Tax=Nocardiopsis sp. CC223A TaxID=3044051 RepID=UPI00278C8AB8|nr:hypothetical protein [Nocardiopsis sp. CC223A]
MSISGALVQPRPHGGGADGPGLAAAREALWARAAEAAESGSRLVRALRSERSTDR